MRFSEFSPRDYRQENRRARRRKLRVEPLERRELLSASGLKASELANFVPPTENLVEPGGYLSKPAEGDAGQIARGFLLAEAPALGLTAADVLTARVTSQYTDAHNGVTHFYLKQTYQGLDIANADLSIHVTRDGRVLSVSDGFVAGLSRTAAAEAVAAPALSAGQALVAAARQLNLADNGGATALEADSVAAPRWSADPIVPKLHYVATAGGLKLSWNFVLRTPDGNHWYDASVDANSGKLSAVHDWVHHFDGGALADAGTAALSGATTAEASVSSSALGDASYRVFALPTESPSDGPRSLVANPQDPVASPFGWHDTDGVAGPEYTDTRGNNVAAQEDRDNNNNTGGYRPSGGANLAFDFSLDLAQAPTVNQDAAITNLFYWNNVLHDLHYQYGFTESAGNFQVNNYGRGGAGNDPVFADAQDGSGTDNANFATPPDGSVPRMQMYNFTSTNPQRDGDFDNGIIVHEYGHGVSNRLTGGPANSNALNALQSGGMGEGWSDFWALMLTQRASDTQNASYPMGTYALGQSPSGAGIRRFPYSYDMGVNPLTLGDYNGSSEVHDSGEIWASALWDLNWKLIEKYGYSSNLYQGSAGNNLTLQLVMDGLKLQPANPTFLQARDAILAADVALSGGANQREIWQAFARRGFGYSASTASANSTTVVEAFDVPSADPIVQSSTPSGAVLTPVSSAAFTFNQEMNTSSFAIASDVVSFTGPGGANLLGQITGFTWVDGRNLRVNFTGQRTTGTYSLTIGPNILAADDGHAMDQDLDGVPGEASDAYTATFSAQAGYNYQALGLNLVPIYFNAGQAGVQTVIDGADDAFGAINLGTNTFRFYGTTYSGAGRLLASTNGLITFDAGTNAYDNTNLTGSPITAAIAPLWDDWRTDSTTTSDVVLSKFFDFNGDTVPDWLGIEWDRVRHISGAGSSQPVIFQAFLQLNTGSNPGLVLFNYIDLDAGNAAYNNAASATVGLKNVGIQGAERSLLSLNSASNPLVAQGKAILYYAIPPASLAAATSPLADNRRAALDAHFASLAEASPATATAETARDVTGGIVATSTAANSAATTKQLTSTSSITASVSSGSPAARLTPPTGLLRLRGPSRE